MKHLCICDPSYKPETRQAGGADGGAGGNDDGDDDATTTVLQLKNLSPSGSK